MIAKIPSQLMLTTLAHVYHAPKATSAQEGGTQKKYAQLDIIAPRVPAIMLTMPYWELVMMMLGT
tara:strand:+ start:101 stop:295 length:195 start_codon:yes stop_codon:yes gene_type:complete